MTTAATTSDRAASAVNHDDAPKGNPWLPTWSGVALVARIEMLRRRPSRKGYIFYGILLGLIALLALLATVAAGNAKTSTPLELILIMVMGTGYLIGPSLSATAINGDSTDGVLAPMQMTRLTAGDLAFGKLLASWAVSGVALLTMVPFLWYAFVRSGWTAPELIVVLAVILFLVLVGTTTGLAWSSIAARNAVSVALTHVTSGFLGLGTLILFAFTLPLVTETVQITERYQGHEVATIDDAGNESTEWVEDGCTEQTFEAGWGHTDRTAWLLMINPVMVIGEASPLINAETWEQDGRAQPGFFAFVHSSLSDARNPAPRPVGADWCAFPDTGVDGPNPWEERQEVLSVYPPQPWLGLAFYALLGAGSMFVVIRRLRVPYKKLRVGTRVA